jgi:Tetratricopeptide repeat
MAEQAWGVGKLDDAARLASTAVAGYKGSSPRVSSILRMRAARAHAMLGDTSDCRAAIDGAYDTFRNSPPEQGEPAWSYWMDETSLNEQIGKCFLYLGDYSAASRHLEMSLHSKNWQGSYVRDGVSVLIALATTHVKAGDPEQACAAAGQAIDVLSGQVDSPRLIVKIERLREDLRPYQKVPAIREFGEKADNLSAELR